MNRALGHLCAHIGQTGPGEPPENGEMIEMTLSSRHRIRNSNTGGLRPVTEAPHNTNCHTWMGKKHFCFFQTAETRNRTPNSGVKGRGANHYPRAPAPQFGQRGVPNFVMAASNHIVAAIQGAETQWHQREIPSLHIYLIYHTNGNKQALLSSAVWLVGLETRDIQCISLFKIVGRYAR